MRGYGLPRNWDCGAPDRADCANYGLKTSISGRLRSKSKANTRRIWKGYARRQAKVQISEQQYTE